MAATNRPASPPARNPKALSLKSLFPTVDLAVIESVLEAHGGSEERAVESLLAMTDKDFVAEERPELDTADSDASYARALALEEEQAADAAARYAARQQQHQQQRSTAEPAFDPTNLPYQPRVRRNQQLGGGYSTYQAQADYGSTYPGGREGGSYPQQQQGPGIEEQFQKLAVEGKKTFQGFMSSGFVKGLKDKVANVQGGITSQGQSHQQQQYPHDPSYSSSGRPSTPSRASSSNAYPSSPAPTGRPQTQNPDFPASEWAVPAPPSRSNSTQAEIHINPSTPIAGSPPTLPSSTGDGSFARLGSPPAAAGGKRSDELIRNAQTGGRQSPSSSMLGTSPTGNLSSSPGGTKIDYAKLGLLPRQKISLDGRPTSPSNLSSSPSNKGLAQAAEAGPNVPPSVVRKIEQQPSAPARQSGLESDDDDDLGYTKSPFDD